MFIRNYPPKKVGSVYFGKKTKELTKWIPEQSIALIQHEDIDQMAALSLIRKQVKAVLNCSASMTGKYASMGTLELRKANIPVYDLLETAHLSLVRTRRSVNDKGNEAWVKKDKATYFLSRLLLYTPQVIEQKLTMAKTNLTESLKLFAENTLQYARKELPEILKPVPIPKLKINLSNRHALVVNRGNGYYEDLLALKPYIAEQQPVLIGVDGGADALMECGYYPDLIVGDMDSVSEEALLSSAELVIHAYPNGEAPGLNRLPSPDLAAHLFPCLGTSEDAAYLLAYHAGASLIVSLGSHTDYD